MLDNCAIDPSLRILVVAGFVLGLFAIYFSLAVLSNRSVRRLRDSLDRRRRPTEVRLRSGRLLPWAIPLMVVAAAGLMVLCVLFGRIVE